MAELATALSWVLAGVLAAAGVAKARRPATTAATFRRLGVPVPRVAARAVPAVELALAVVLLFAPRIAAIPALALLAGFTVVLLRVLRRGEDVACGCFGSASTEPVTAAELVRNALLALAAAAGLAAPTTPGVPSVPAIVAATTAALIGLVVVALVRLGAQTGRGLLDASVPPGPKGLA